MSERYNPAEIEPKWQQQWQADELYRSVIDHEREKYYFMTMLPYPSGDLHIGHWYAMTPSDAKARYLRMKGYNVLFPMGFDAFGLPAENAAIQRGIHPMTWTMSNIENMRRQLRSMGAMIDWNARRSVATQVTIAGRSGSSSGSMTWGWRTGRRPRSISARSATRPWPGSRSGAKTAIASAAARRSSKKT